MIEEESHGDVWTGEFNDTKKPAVASSAPWDTPPQKFDENAPPAPPAPPRGAWAVACCGRCGEYSIWRDDRLIFPAGSTVPSAHEEMPSSARELYDEGREVVGTSRRAGAALARASLERLLKTLDPDAGKASLAGRIDRISERVSPSLEDMLSVIRHAGNKSLHVEDDPDELTTLVLDAGQEEIVEYIFTAINNLVDELITRPRKAREMYEMIPPESRANIERAKDQRST